MFTAPSPLSINSAGRDVRSTISSAAYVFNVFGWLAEAARG
jgi:hypothetical protein